MKYEYKNIPHYHHHVCNLLSAMINLRSNQSKKKIIVSSVNHHHILDALWYLVMMKKSGCHECLPHKWNDRWSWNVESIRQKTVWNLVFFLFLETVVSISLHKKENECKDLLIVIYMFDQNKKLDWHLLLLSFLFVSNQIITFQYYSSINIEIHVYITLKMIYPPRNLNTKCNVLSFWIL